MTNPTVPGSQLRLLSFGAGAIGTYIGGSLALAGHSVVFLEMPGTAEQLRASGLSLEIDGQVKHLPSPALAITLEEAVTQGPFDAAIFALKAYDTRSILEDLILQRQQLPPLLCLQNGVANETILASALGSEKVIAGTVTSSIGRRGPGQIVLERLRGVGIAEQGELSHRLADAFSQAGLNASLFASGLGMKWSKLITNLPANATSAILNLTPAEIFANPNLFRFEIRQLREALAVMSAQGIPLVDLPGTPVRLFGFAIRRLPVSLSRPILQRAIGRGRGAKMPSFHIDLHSGRGKSEVAYLNGAVADASELLSVPAPANRFLTDTLMALTQGKLPVNTYAKNPGKFLRDFRYSTTP